MHGRNVVNNTSFSNILFLHNPEQRTLIRKIEKLNEKVNTAKTAVIFNEKCIADNLLPKYTNIYIPKNRNTSYLTAYCILGDHTTRKIEK